MNILFCKIEKKYSFKNQMIYSDLFNLKYNPLIFYFFNF